jgi:phenylacetate-CoA ligase
MDIGLIARVLARRRRLRRQESWGREELQAHQLRELSALRRYAFRESPFYQKFHQGLEGKPLEDLPVLTKSRLMGEFDDLVTDRNVRISGVQAHLASLKGPETYLGKYRVTRTAGTTGHPAILLANPSEWVSIIASYERAQRWAGVHAGLGKPTRLAVVSSLVPWHQSAQIGLSVHSPIVPVRRFDAKQSIDGIVAGLNEWQPDNLIAYSSMARALSEEQLSGRLRISPHAVMCASEVLTKESRQKIEQAWGRAPFNVYGATEAAGIASECANHTLHLYEDLVITEVVDENNRPVPVGQYGAKVLVTVLFSRTQPLIRYEVSDSVALAPELECGCGSSFRAISGIQGRAEEFIMLPSNESGRVVTIHPNVFHDVLEPLTVSGWQVVQEPDRLRVLLVGASKLVEPGRLEADLARALELQGASRPSISVEEVDAIPKTALGKAPLIKALPRGSGGTAEHSRT